MDLCSILRRFASERLQFPDRLFIHTDFQMINIDEKHSLVHEFCKNVTRYAFSVGTIFLEVWKRRNATLAYEWDVDSFEETEPDRPQFYGTERKPVSLP